MTCVLEFLSLFHFCYNSGGEEKKYDKFKFNIHLALSYVIHN